MISKALTNRDYDSLEGLVAEDMIKVLRTKIETLSPEQRCLITVNEKDVVFHILCDITAMEGGKRIIKLIPVPFQSIHTLLVKSFWTLSKLITCLQVKLMYNYN